MSHAADSKIVVRINPDWCARKAQALVADLPYKHIQEIFMRDMLCDDIAEALHDAWLKGKTES